MTTNQLGNVRFIWSRWLLRRVPRTSQKGRTTCSTLSPVSAKTRHSHQSADFLV